MSRRPEYWVNLFTLKTWEESVKAGSRITGFREIRWGTVKKITPGDYLLCYITGLSRFVALQRAMDKPVKETNPVPIWTLDSFPCRVPVETVAELDPETAVPVIEMRNQLSIFKDLKFPNAWGIHFRASPAKMSAADGSVIAEAILDAVKHPVKRPFDPSKYREKLKPVETKNGPVTVPDIEEPESPQDESSRGTTAHTEMQWFLLKLGIDMGYDVWVARNDRGKECNGVRFADMRGLQDKLPLQFDEATNKTIELIDVLWLSKNAIVSAFEIESTTSIYSGLLRMSDLVSMQPNLNIPLFILAPDERIDRVISEINRPTFSRLSQPLSEICRYISFSSLRNFVDQHLSVLRHLKPDVISSDEVSESCEIGQV